MQNRYVGDIGDFAKYGLLRQLIANNDLTLGIVWCLFHDESHNTDGRHTGYLKDQRLRSADPYLHDQLQRIVGSGPRSVSEVSAAGIFPGDTRFYTEPICCVRVEDLNREQRKERRRAWLAGALEATKSADLVFLDPDNGLEVPSVPRTTARAGKYIFWDELKAFWSRGHSLIVYHHLNRTKSVLDQGNQLKGIFEENFPDAALLTGVLSRRGSCRHFWIVVQKSHKARLKQRLETLMSSPWGHFFESV